MQFTQNNKYTLITAQLMSKVIYKMIRLTAYDKYRKFTGTKKFNKNEQQGM